MGVAFSRLLQAVRLDRDAFVWMNFNDRATADALLFVPLTRFLILLGSGWSLLGVTTSARGLAVLFNVMVTSVIFWLAYAGLTYAVVRFLFQRGGTYAVYLRVTGFAYPTLLLVIFTRQLGLSDVAAIFAGSVWFLAVVTRGITYESDLPTDRAAVSAVLGLVAWVIVASILNRSLI
ncbi:MAG: hypothetical protein ACE5GC_07865 [Acidimicrobiia bacterium]